MKRSGYYVAHMRPPYYGHERGDIAGPLKSYDDAKRFARDHVQDTPLGIYRVYSRGARRDLEWTVHPQKIEAVSTRSRKKSPDDLSREIAEVLKALPINRRKRVRHFSEWKDKTGAAHYAVTYEDLSGHPITLDELQRYRQREA